MEDVDMTPLTEEQAAAIADLSAAFPGDRLVVIGAVAIGCHFPDQWRRTNDLDLTLTVDLARFDAVESIDGWSRDPALEYRFTSASGLRVDLLPSSPRNLAAGQVVFAATGQVMNLTGFDLALEHFVDVALPGRPGHALVATVPVIVVLKMAAFLDRPYERDRDLVDLAAVFQSYLPSDDERRWEPPLLDSGIEYRSQGAFAVGRDLAAIAAPVHRALIEQFLEALSVERAHFARFARVCPGPAEGGEELAEEWLAAFRRGVFP